MNCSTYKGVLQQLSIALIEILGTHKRQIKKKTVKIEATDAEIFSLIWIKLPKLDCTIPLMQHDSIFH